MRNEESRERQMHESVGSGPVYAEGTTTGSFFSFLIQTFTAIGSCPEGLGA
jgi:hypothetical protein